MGLCPGLVWPKIYKYKTEIHSLPARFSVIQGSMERENGMPAPSVYIVAGPLYLLEVAYLDLAKEKPFSFHVGYR